MTSYNTHGVLLISCALALGVACIGCEKSSDKSRSSDKSQSSDKPQSSDKWSVVLDQYEKYSEQRVSLDEKATAGDKNASSEVGLLIRKVRPLVDQLQMAHDRGWLTDAQEERLKSLNRRMFGPYRAGMITVARLGINNIKSALQNFEMNCDRFPTTQEGLQALIHSPGNLPGWKGPYLDQQALPLEDPWQQPYAYRCPGQHNNDYDLYSYGPDMQDGGGDDIDNWSHPSPR